VVQETYRFQTSDEFLRYDNTIDPELVLSRILGLVEFTLPMYQASPVNFQDIRLEPLTRALITLYPSEPASDESASPEKSDFDLCAYSGLMCYESDLTPNFSVNLASDMYKKVLQHLEDSKHPTLEIEIAIECWTPQDYGFEMIFIPWFGERKGIDPNAIKFELSEITFENRL